MKVGTLVHDKSECTNMYSVLIGGVLSSYRLVVTPGQQIGCRIARQFAYGVARSVVIRLLNITLFGTNHLFVLGVLSIPFCCKDFVCLNFYLPHLLETTEVLLYKLMHLPLDPFFLGCIRPDEKSGTFMGSLLCLSI